MPGGRQQMERVEYYDAKGNLDSKWVDEKARNTVDKLVPGRDDYRKAKKGDKRNINAAQLRRFYSEVKTLERVWKTRCLPKDADENLELAKLLPQLKILKAKVAYARGREVVPTFFQDWITAHVNAVNTPKDFQAFLLHFEAVVGFAKQYLGKD